MEEVKAWQHGYPLETLLAIEKTYARYNQHSLSPFSIVKKNTIAEKLFQLTLHVSPERDEGVPRWAYNCAVTKVHTSMRLFQDIEVARREKGDVVLTHIAGDWSDASWRAEWIALLDGITAPLWVQVWADDAEMCKIVSATCRRVGSKVSTFGEVLTWFFRDAEDTRTPRVFSTIPSEHLLGCCQLLLEPTFADCVSDMTRELSALSLAFTNHYSNYNANKAWSALALRGYSADPGVIEKPAEMNEAWHFKHHAESFALQDTVLRAQLPAVERILTHIAPEGIWHRIRLMRLSPGGGELKRHTDQVDTDSGVGLGQLMRIHVPLETNEHVTVTVWDEYGAPHEEHMPVGTAWMLDTRWPHCAVNAGETPRIHLVLDVETTFALLERLHA